MSYSSLITGGGVSGLFPHFSRGGLIRHTPNHSGNLPQGSKYRTSQAAVLITISWNCNISWIINRTEQTFWAPLRSLIKLVHDMVANDIAYSIHLISTFVFKPRSFRRSYAIACGSINLSYTVHGRTIHPKRCRHLRSALSSH